QALDLFTQAAAIDDTPETRTGIAQAKKKLADAAGDADKKRQYATLIDQAEAAVKAQNWQQALDLYTKASAIDNTREAQTGIATARKKLADAVGDADKKKEYDRLIAQANAAVGAQNWQQALDLFTKAGEINDTPEVRAGIAAAKKKLADAGNADADKKREFTRLMRAADTAARREDWQEALDNYTKAAALDNTSEAQAGIALAKKKLADAAVGADKKKQYTALIDQAEAAVKAQNWQLALDLYTKASAIDDTREAQAGIAKAKQKLADAAAGADKKREFAKLMTDANAAAQAQNWQQALDLFTKADAIDRTPETRAGIALAKQKLADAAGAADKKRELAKLLADAAAAGQAGDWQKAVDLYTKAAAIENTLAVQAALANAKQKLADASAGADKKRQYQKLIADANAAIRREKWQDAIDALKSAAALDNTAEVAGLLATAQKGVTYQKFMDAAKAAGRADDWAAALDNYTRADGVMSTDDSQAGIRQAKKKLYDKAATEGKSAAQAQQWQRSLDAWTKAYNIDPTNEAKAGIALAKKKLAEGGH
ncbi:MAG: hypothetical protein PHU85_08745, partial [Phycisphaerae bacterium]|nr:hypothetical protein [Phycisphaerae bacterium]